MPTVPTGHKCSVEEPRVEDSSEASKARSQSTEVVEEEQDSEPELPEPRIPESLVDLGLHGMRQPEEVHEGQAQPMASQGASAGAKQAGRKHRERPGARLGIPRESTQGQARPQWSGGGSVFSPCSRAPPVHSASKKEKASAALTSGRHHCALWRAGPFVSSQRPSWVLRRY